MEDGGDRVFKKLYTCTWFACLDSVTKVKNQGKRNAEYDQESTFCLPTCASSKLFVNLLVITSKTSKTSSTVL